MLLALTGTVTGIDGFLWVVAFLAFLIAVIVAAVVTPKNWWAVLVAAGLCLAALTQLVH